MMSVIPLKKLKKIKRFGSLPIFYVHSCNAMNWRTTRNFIELKIGWCIAGIFLFAITCILYLCEYLLFVVVILLHA